MDFFFDDLPSTSMSTPKKGKKDSLTLDDAACDLSRNTSSSVSLNEIERQHSSVLPGSMEAEPCCPQSSPVNAIAGIIQTAKGTLIRVGNMNFVSYYRIQSKLVDKKVPLAKSGQIQVWEHTQLIGYPVAAERQLHWTSRSSPSQSVDDEAHLHPIKCSCGAPCSRSPLLFV
ncbi:hypothetical protein GOODEAATRI_005917 [Goodea atripinnis]|uniref:Uncharacterized protein n=1 Tax=Goodea atripinnis TaxID=208336 RepID=A0ABV0PL88_9TELE